MVCGGSVCVCRSTPPGHGSVFRELRVVFFLYRRRCMKCLEVQDFHKSFHQWV